MTFNYGQDIVDWKDGKDHLANRLKRSAPNLFFGKREPDIDEMEFNLKIKFDDAKFDKKKITCKVKVE
jgi:hypothetical protein